MAEAAVLFFLGVATWYGGPYVGQPLYCGGWYEVGGEPWVAVDVDEYARGRVRCGDVMLIYFANGEFLQARAMDAGPFVGYYITDFGVTPIVVDVPQHLWPLGAARSGRVRMVNVSAARRGMERWAGK